MSASSEFCFFYSKGVIQLYDWTDLVANDLMKFSIVDNPPYPSHVKYDSVSQIELRKYVDQLSRWV